MEYFLAFLVQTISMVLSQQECFVPRSIYYEYSQMITNLHKLTGSQEDISFTHLLFVSIASSDKVACLIQPGLE